MKKKKFDLYIFFLLRTKRSGSGDILGTVQKTISSGLSSKLGYIASASAGASSLLTSGSSKGHSDHGYTYSAPSVSIFETDLIILN